MASSKNFSKSRKGGNGQGSDVLSFTACTLLQDRVLAGAFISLYGVLDEIGSMYGHIKRSLFKDFMATGKKPLSFKNAYLLRFGITARQFNAIRYDLGAKYKLRCGSPEETHRGYKKQRKIRQRMDRGQGIKDWPPEKRRGFTQACA